MPSTETQLEIAQRLMLALCMGASVGLERSYHGRPAGFRTHALVCLSTSLLMLVTVYEGLWFTSHGESRVTLDPTRMAQGIMTGIGFLGAGAIIKEGFTIRGLTTAASIWITAAIGVLVGIGFYFPAILAVALALGTLSLFRWIEGRISGLSSAEAIRVWSAACDVGAIKKMETSRTSVGIRLIRTLTFMLCGPRMPYGSFE